MRIVVMVVSKKLLARECNMYAAGNDFFPSVPAYYHTRMHNTKMESFEGRMRRIIIVIFIIYTHTYKAHS